MCIVLDLLDEPISRARGSIVVDDFGVDLAQSALEDSPAVQAAFLDALRSKNRAHWVLGDLWLERSELLLDSLDPTVMSLKTVENYASVCRTFPKVWRKVPLSMSHYEASAKLATVRPTDALALLQSAYNGGMSREWVRTEAKRILGETDTSIEVLLTWDADHGVFVPNVSLNLPTGTSRTIRIKQVA